MFLPWNMKIESEWAVYKRYSVQKQTNFYLKVSYLYRITFMNVDNFDIKGVSWIRMF